MNHFDSIIIGAGPGGLSCATRLAICGQKVLVLEKNRTVGPKVCAGGIPFQAVCTLNLPEELLEGSFPDQHIYTPWQKSVLSSSSPIIVTVNRHRLGQWMSQKAAEAGVVIQTGTAVTGISASHVYTKKDIFSYKYLVGADGSNSLVRRHLNIPTQRVGLGINFQIAGLHPNMEWHLNPKLFRSGYAWVFPHKDSTSVGIYAERNDLRPPVLKQRLLAWAAQQKIDLGGSRLQAFPINFDYQGWRFGHLFLVGDAAGLASGFTGEGIYPAIISGETVARTIIKPECDKKELNRIISQHRRHQRMQKFYTGNKVICQISLEMLILAFRLRLLKFSLLEMH